MVLQIFRKQRMWEQRPLQDRYDVVIIGAGVHGLSTAYYLGKLGVTNVAVLDKGYIGGGASARTTAIIRANYLTPQGGPLLPRELEALRTSLRRTSTSTSCSASRAGWTWATRTHRSTACDRGPRSTGCSASTAAW